MDLVHIVKVVLRYLVLTHKLLHLFIVKRIHLLLKKELLLGLPFFLKLLSFIVKTINIGVFLAGFRSQRHILPHIHVLLPKMVF